MRLFSLLILAVLITLNDGLACPACLPAGDTNALSKSILAVGIMAMLPILVFAYIYWKIIGIQNDEKS